MNFTDFKNKMDSVTENLKDELTELDNDNIPLTSDYDVYDGLFPSVEKREKTEMEKKNEERANKALAKLNLVSNGAEFYNRAFDAMDSVGDEIDDVSVEEPEPIEQPEKEVGKDSGIKTTELNAGENMENNNENEPEEETFTFNAKQLNDFVNMAIKKRIAGKTPSVTSENKLPMTVKDFKKLDYKARLDLYKKNPVAYKMLVDKSK